MGSRDELFGRKSGGSGWSGAREKGGWSGATGYRHTGGDGLDEDDFDEGSHFLGGAMSQQQAQDDHLDAIGDTLKRVGQMAEGFNSELQAQNELLDEVGTNLEQTNQAMRIMGAKTTELVESAGGPRW
eukprot:CAMPEP_0184552204 /NCGR_PEP_ID=MMETSP0199_2-20130426/28167_1 /TAXON_ID=1112570 /ORGANISM="Thraustochytrium sp., Strain LLF1b" /LENGTH=127 /DNA_ID=CAMNT_0026947631 /DNA_START=28 /DNA_END=408 /DNA_ORIENTATION=-